MGKRIVLTLRKEDKRIPGTSKGWLAWCTWWQMKGKRPRHMARMYLCKHIHTHTSYTQTEVGYLMLTEGQKNIILPCVWKVECWDH